jgi:hypothetical protein
MAKGQAAALHGFLVSEGADGIGAAEALERQLDALYSQWEEAVEAARKAKEQAA